MCVGMSLRNERLEKLDGARLVLGHTVAIQAATSENEYLVELARSGSIVF